MSCSHLLTTPSFTRLMAYVAHRDRLTRTPGRLLHSACPHVTDASKTYPAAQNLPTSQNFPKCTAHLEHSLFLVLQYKYSILQSNNSVYIANILYGTCPCVMAILLCYFLIEYKFEPHSEITYNMRKIFNFFSD